MQGYNLIIVYNESAEQILMCRRLKEPYKGLINLVGGKIEPGEDGLSAAYRELFEETSITSADIVLTHLMDFTYFPQDCRVEVYMGRLLHSVTVYGDENTLFWSDLRLDFFDMTRYAGEGNIGHMLEIARQCMDAPQDSARIIPEN